MSQGMTRRKFTKEFKLEAVRLSRQPGMAVTKAARDLGIRAKDLYRWRIEFAKAHRNSAASGGGGRVLMPW